MSANLEVEQDLSDCKRPWHFPLRRSGPYLSLCRCSKHKNHSEFKHVREYHISARSPYNCTRYIRHSLHRILRAVSSYFKTHPHGGRAREGVGCSRFRVSLNLVLRRTAGGSNTGCISSNNTIIIFPRTFLKALPNNGFGVMF